MQADPGMPRLGTSVVVTHGDDLVPHQRLEKFHRRRMSDKPRDLPTEKLHIWPHLLMDAVIDGLGVEFRRLGLQLGDLFDREEMRQHEVTFDFDLADLFAQRERGPVAVVDAGRIHWRAFRTSEHSHLRGWSAAHFGKFLRCHAHASRGRVFSRFFARHARSAWAWHDRY
jgi:hypothetical protein